MLPVHQARRAPRDAEIERTQEAGVDRPRAGTVGRSLDRGKRAPHAARSTTSSGGAGTAASAASIRASAATSVAIAS